MDLVIEGNAYINGRIQKCCIGIDQDKGTIRSIKKLLKGEKNLDFGDKLILPSGIDAHVHFRDPGQTNKEDFFTGTVSAAYGGISCVLDMPNNIPPIDTIDLLEDKILMAKRKACIDFGLYAEINSKNIDQIPLMAKKCTAFKLYLPNVQDLSNISRKLPEHKVIAIHAEDGKCVEKYKKMEKSLADHSNSRPTECEVEAIKKMMRNGKDKKNRLHICHLSSMEGLATLKKYKNEKVSVGVTPHHLLLSIDSNFRLQSFGKVNPPLREKKDNHSLFEGIMNGTIDIIESDHAPHSIEEKEKKFDDAPSGIPGVETSLPLFLSLVKKRRIPLSRLVNLFCERPAEIFKIKKGKISIGNDADLIIIKLEEKKIKSEELHSKCGWSPFEGMDAIFPTNAFLRGERIIEDGEFVGEKGYGKFIGE